MSGFFEHIFYYDIVFLPVAFFVFFLAFSVLDRQLFHMDNPPFELCHKAHLQDFVS